MDCAITRPDDESHDQQELIKKTGKTSLFLFFWGVDGEADDKKLAPRLEEKFAHKERVPLVSYLDILRDVHSNILV